MQVIIYKNDVGGTAVIYPTNEVVARYGIEAVAKKDVPSGKPYKIIDSSKIPQDREVRNQLDESTFTDGIGGKSNKFMDNK